MRGDILKNTNLTNLSNADMRNAFGVWNLTNDDRRRTMISSQSSLLPVGQCGFAGSLPPFGQYASHVIREILNTGGVSFQWSFVRFVRFVFKKLGVVQLICANRRDLWATTKRTMRQRTGWMFLFSHGSHRSTQMPFGVMDSHRSRRWRGRSTQIFRMRRGVYDVEC